VSNIITLLRLAKFVGFDDQGEIRRCDWLQTSKVCVCAQSEFQKKVVQPTTAPYLPLIIKPRNLAKDDGYSWLEAISTPIMAADTRGAGRVDSDAVIGPFTDHRTALHRTEHGMGNGVAGVSPETGGAGGKAKAYTSERQAKGRGKRRTRKDRKEERNGN
jgi:hypothetical protein